MHYASQYRLFGPLIHYSTLRYEAKHSNLKTIFSTSKNYVNPCLSIAKRHQYLQSLHIRDTNFFPENNPQFSKKHDTIPLDIFDDNINAQINNIHPIEIEEFTCYKFVKMNGITYEVDNIIVHDAKDH